jgi:cobalt transporter subunit CbtB
MHPVNPASAGTSGAPSASASRLALAYLTPALLGMALLSVIGFAHYPAVHDAFHDLRHTAGFPCH